MNKRQRIKEMIAVAEKYKKLCKKRGSNKTKNCIRKSIKWGKEIYDLVENYKSKGLSEHIAKSVAYTDFKEKHKDDTRPIPGKDSDTLKRYYDIAERRFTK